MRRIPLTGGWEVCPSGNPLYEMFGLPQLWEPVTLPHDATIGGERRPEVGHASGFIPGGSFTYRNRLAVPEEWRDRRVLLEFEAVYRSAVVRINEALAGQCASGYTGFVVDLDPWLKYGDDNEIRVECRSDRDSRWYAGAGIHRPVHLVTGPLVHIGLDSIRVTTHELRAELAVIEVAFTVENHERGLRTVEAHVTLNGPDGDVVISGESPVSVLPGEPAVVRQRFVIPEPAAWSPESPRLYTANVVLDNGLDEESVAFGIRTVTADSQRGLQLNGQPVLVRGACIHSDNGVLGAAAIDRADERRVERLKAAGFNALRSAHNPMSRAMLEACDRLGVIVVDELTDMWTLPKSNDDFASALPQWWEHDVEAMVRKDANHPSVLFYSTGNEIPDVGKPYGAAWSRRIAEKVRQLDPTRLVTNGMSGMLAILRPGVELPGLGDINTVLAEGADGWGALFISQATTDATAEAFSVLDVAGMNYMEARYELDRELFPSRVILGTESMPPLIDRTWRQVLDNPHVIGDFTWTGWDYIGEAGIGGLAVEQPTPYPWLLAWCGDIDITGHRRPASYYREIVFGLRRDPYLAVQRPERPQDEQLLKGWAWTDCVASWTWEGCEGRPLIVEVYGDADEVELLLNDEPVGRALIGEQNRFRAELSIPYVPGLLVAVAYTGGKETGRCALRTAEGEPVLTLAVDRDEIRADDTDLAFVDVTLQDADGTVFTGHDREVRVVVEGAGVLQGLGSAAPATEESYVDDVHTTFDGRALAVVRPTGAGSIRVTATAIGCAPVTAELIAR